MSTQLDITLRALVAFERGRRVLTSQWGFDNDHHEVQYVPAAVATVPPRRHHTHLAWRRHTAGRTGQCGAVLRPNRYWQEPGGRSSWLRARPLAKCHELLGSAVDSAVHIEPGTIPDVQALLGMACAASSRSRQAVTVVLGWDVCRTQAPQARSLFSKALKISSRSRTKWCDPAPWWCVAMCVGPALTHAARLARLSHSHGSPFSKYAHCCTTYRGTQGLFSCSQLSRTLRWSRQPVLARGAHSHALYLLRCSDPRHFLSDGVDLSVSQILKFSVQFEPPTKDLRRKVCPGCCGRRSERQRRNVPCPLVMASSVARPHTRSR